MVLKGLQPEGVLGYFEKISSIPRGSGNCNYIADFLLEFAKKNNLEYIKDEIGNIVIRKDATMGYENAPGIVLQGHMDMVCVATERKKIDFEKEGISLQTDGEKIWADQTSLGADDGIAIAYALEILASKIIPHPALEVLFTVDEEIGLLGANAFEPNMLKGCRMINLDSEEEGVLTISCAGGARAIGAIPTQWTEREGVCFRLEIQGLQGGHSGTEIHKHRVNANQLLGRTLTYLYERCEYYLGQVEGGKKENAIPYEAFAVLYLKKEEKEKLQKEFEIFSSRLQKELSIREPYLQMSLMEEKGEEKMLTKEVTEKIIFFLYHSPNGIVAMNPKLTDMVQSSLNLGMLYMEKDQIKVKYSIRSSVTSEKEEIKERLNAFFEHIGGEIKFYAEYPAWEYREDSPLRDIAIKAYHAVYNDKPKVMAIHAGLECGIFVGKRPDLDCISFGPDLENAHTVKETIDVESVHRTWHFLLEILRRSKK